MRKEITKKNKFFINSRIVFHLLHVRDPIAMNQCYSFIITQRSIRKTPRLKLLIHITVRLLKCQIERGRVKYNKYIKIYTIVPIVSASFLFIFLLRFIMKNQQTIDCPFQLFHMADINRVATSRKFQ